MIPKRIPETRLVVGAGAIGLEFPSFSNEFGSKVVLVELLPQILPGNGKAIALGEDRGLVKTILAR